MKYISSIRTGIKPAIICILILIVSFSFTSRSASLKKISENECYNKIYGAWLGQMIGNIYGLPHECKYIEEPGPDKFPYGYSKNLNKLQEIGGAYSDDDTDIEYMYLLQMMKFGPEPSYQNLAEAWKYHVRKSVWLANRAALSLMHFGYDPPLTGKKENNPHWFQIDPQLINEIWAYSAPGMVNYAAKKSNWAARLTSDDWGVEPTMFYGAMYAAAFFETDIHKLIKIGIAALPKNCYFSKTIADMQIFHSKYPNDWKMARKEMAEKYYINNPPDTKTIWNANLNGACAILALLYGDGDFQKTLDLSCAIGFDCDNQAATLSGLLGVISGADGLPKDLLFAVAGWDKPFNDFYKNVSRYDLPDSKITDMAENTLKQAQLIIAQKGGKIETVNGETIYYINPKAEFIPPLELPKTPLPVFEVNSNVDYQFYATIPANKLIWEITKGTLPSGVNFKNGMLSGSVTATGIFPLTLKISYNESTIQQDYQLIIHSKNLALSASEVISNVRHQNASACDSLWITIPKSVFVNDIDKVLNDGIKRGDNSTFYSISSKGEKTDFYGYIWKEKQSIGQIAYYLGSMEEHGGWFQDLNVEFLADDGQWKPVENIHFSPEFVDGNQVYIRPHFVRYDIGFNNVSTIGVRIIGKAGGGTQKGLQPNGYWFTSISELSVYEK